MKKISAAIIVSALPIITLAQTTVNRGSVETSPALGIGGIFDLLGSFLSRGMLLLISVAVVWFAYNVFQYTISGNEEKKQTAKNGMFWGIVGIFVMVSIWGLVAILQQTFGTAGFNAGNTATDLKNMVPTF